MAAKQAVSYLVKETRERLSKLTRGCEDALVKKTFADFDLNQSGSLTIDELTSMIAKL